MSHELVIGLSILLMRRWIDRLSKRPAAELALCR